MFRRCRRSVGARGVVAAVVAASTVIAAASPSAAAPIASQVSSPGTAQAPARTAVGTGTTLRPVQPCRLFDGRITPDLGRLDAGTWRIRVAGRCGVPDGARAVALGIVAAEAAGTGFVTAWPTGIARPEVSNLNFARGNTVSNSAVVQLGPTGEIDVFVSAQAALVIDVSAAFVDAGPEAAGGRFVPVEPRRSLDTRQNGQRGDGDIPLPLPPAVPSDATALAVTVTAVDAATPGFLSAFPAGTPRPNASVVNTDPLNTTRASAMFLPVTPAGAVIHRSMTTDVIVDVWGWFTGDSAVASGDGLFVPQSPTRVWDSRATFDPVQPGGGVERAIVGAGMGAVVANVTALDATDTGFLSIHAAGTALPEVSSLNYRWPQPVAALAISRVSDRGIGVHSYAGVHVLVDVAGWFTGSPARATLPPPSNPFPTQPSDVLFIGDSSFTGIRWNGALGFLQGANFDSRLESCRRLIGASCRGREGYAPATALTEIWSATPGRYSTAVIATGYNDWSGSFPMAVDAIVAAARAKGIDRVVWMTYRENVGYVSPSGLSNASSFALNNQVLRAAMASGAYPELALADWHTYTLTRREWLAGDGVHFTVAGARAAAEYTSRVVAARERRPCPPGIGGATTAGGWCADPDVTGPPG